MRTVTRNLSAAISVASLTALLLAPASSQAQTNVYTDPVGFITLTAVPAGYSFWGIGMTQIPTQRGLISSVSGTAVGLSTTLTPGQYNATANGAAYYIEDVNSNSAYAGFSDDIVSNDASYVYTANNDSGQLTVGDGFKVFPHQTLGTVFGPHNDYGVVQGSNTAANADSVSIWNPVTQTAVPYFYRTTGTAGWRGPLGLTIDASNTPVYVDQGITIQRKYSGTNINLQLVGAVKLGATITSAPAGSSAVNAYVFVSDMYASSVTLNSLNLYTGNTATGVVGSNTAVNADSVSVWNPVSQSFVPYFYRTTGTAGWRGPQGLTIDAGTNVLALGSVIQIQRKYSPAFNWTIPPQY